MDIGVMVNETTMLPMRTVGNATNESASLALDLRRKELLVYFKLPIFNPGQKQAAPGGQYHEYRLRIPFAQMTKIFEASDPASETVSHMTTLDVPPLYYRRIKDISSTFIDDNSWRAADTWFRQTDIVHNPQELAGLPVNLRKFKPLIDIGERNETSPC